MECENPENMIYPLIFSDLDGTLLDHDDYSFHGAIDALEKIRKWNIPLILNTSKTMDEVVEVRTALQNQHPFVVENGGAVLIPQGYFPDCERPLTKHIFGRHRDEFIPVIHRIRKSGNYAFEGFSDFTVSEISQETGLPLEQAANAMKRTASEPIKWLGDQESMNLFRRELERQNLRLIKGGRFWHIMGNTDKAGAMHWLVTQYRNYKNSEVIVIAMGDSQNDKAMLEQADLAAVIRSSNGDHMHISKPEKSVIYSEKQGADGWQEAFDEISKRLRTG